MPPSRAGPASRDVPADERPADTVTATASLRRRRTRLPRRRHMRPLGRVRTVRGGRVLRVDRRHRLSCFFVDQPTQDVEAEEDADGAAMIDDDGQCMPRFSERTDDLARRLLWRAEQDISAGQFGGRPFAIEPAQSGLQECRRAKHAEQLPRLVDDEEPFVAAGNERGFCVPDRGSPAHGRQGFASELPNYLRGRRLRRDRRQRRVVARRRLEPECSLRRHSESLVTQRI